MLLIAIDTSGRKGSIALCRGDRDSFEVLQLTSLEGGNYSAQLMPQIATTLQQHGLKNSDVDAFVVVSGPGSFTGLRVGLATAKGLCEVLQKPLAQVSTLEAIAVTCGSPGETATALLDAGRGEAYVGEYQVGEHKAQIVREYIAKLADLRAQAEATGGRRFTPEIAIAEFLRNANVPVETVAPLQADQIARIGLRKLLAGDLSDAATIDVNYVRRSDAELFIARR
jgi:tRNA threonylcarbamoyladenosine biosynthesis protein TsaB